MADTSYEISAGFFDAIDEDRTYSANDMNRPYRRLISEGIFATAEGETSDDFQILAADDGMNVIVSAGEGLLGEKWIENSSNFLLTITSNSETLTRIDSIILQVDTTQSGRVGNIVYRTGTASSSPVHPDINTEDDIYEFRLADITVSSSCTEITQDLITDCRGSDECPWITSLIYQVDTSTLYAQWQAAYQQFYSDTEEEFNEWFESIKDILNDDTVGNLSNLISINTTNISTNTTAINENALRCETITLSVDNWTQNTDTEYYEYDVEDEDVTADHLVEGKMDLDNQAKMTDGYIESYDGGYKIITSECPEEDITINISKQKSVTEEES